MHLSDQSDLLKCQWALLNEKGPSLNNYFIPESFDSPIFFPLPSEVQHKIHKKYAMDLRYMRSCGVHMNSCFHIFGCVLLKMLFEDKEGITLLQKLKCILYSPDLNIIHIKNKPHAELRNNSMKKILVEFFQILESIQKINVEEMLRKYPIILKILTLLFRSILKKMGLKKIENYYSPAQPTRFIPILCDYFEIGFMVREEMFVFERKNMFIFVDKERKLTLYGVYEEDEDEKSAKQKSLNFDLIDNSAQTPSQNPQKWAQKQLNLIETPYFPRIDDEEINFNIKESLKKRLKLKAENFTQALREEEDERRKTEVCLPITKKNLKQTDEKLWTEKKLGFSSEFESDNQKTGLKLNRMKKQYSHKCLFHQRSDSSKQDNNKILLGFFSEIKTRKNKLQIKSKVFQFTYNPRQNQKITKNKNKLFYSIKQKSQFQQLKKPYKIPQFLHRRTKTRISENMKKKMPTQPFEDRELEKSNLQKQKIFFTYNASKDKLRELPGRSHILTPQKSKKFPENIPKHCRYQSVALKSFSGFEFRNEFSSPLKQKHL